MPPMSPSPLASATAERVPLPPLRGKVTDLGTVAGRKVLWLPLTLIFTLYLMAGLPRIGGNPVLKGTFFGAAGVLLAWLAALFLRLHADRRGGGGIRSFQIVLRAQHYVQAPCHLSIY